MAVWPVNFSISLADGPLPMKRRPCQPSESHGTSEPGPPERRLVVGWRTPSGVFVSCSEYALLATLTKPWSSRPVTIR